MKLFAQEEVGRPNTTPAANPQPAPDLDNLAQGEAGGSEL